MWFNIGTCIINKKSKLKASKLKKKTVKEIAKTIKRTGRNDKLVSKVLREAAQLPQP